MAVIGIDLGGTKLALAVFSNDGIMITKEIVPINKREGKQVGGLITHQLNKTLKQSSENIEAVGICIPGIAYHKTGKVWAPNIPGWDNYPLLAELKVAVNDEQIKIKIDSDRACCILGEVWQGAAKGCNDAIFITVGTGIGAGILVNGEVIRGSNDISGAIGWFAFNKPYLQKYIQCGCLEYHASGEGIAKVAKEIIGEDKFYKGDLSKEIHISAYDVFEAYKSNDVIAEKTLKLAVEFWGMAAANLVSLFNPEKIIWGGGIFGPAVQFLENIFNEAHKWAQPISINQVSFEASKLGGDAGLYGAGYLALKSKGE